jgi:NTP pyrophosphatase (non-canonical NTP hydrolase)
MGFEKDYKEQPLNSGLLMGEKKVNKWSIKILKGNLEETKARTIPALVKRCHETAKSKGWWDTDRNDGEIIALMHSELSEALEALRKEDVANLTEELADVLIRIFDYCGARNLNIEKALLEKMEKNKARPYKHGKRF